MVKLKQQFICQQCGARFTKWMGRCENCGEWNSLVDQAAPAQGSSAVAKGSQAGTVLAAEQLGAVRQGQELRRLGTGIADVDTVLGGGILPGGVTLLAGQPGIGKSTLLLQLTAHIASQHPVLYVSGEESAQQVALRAERLGAHTSQQLDFAASTSADDIAATIRSGSYQLVVIDSIQTLALSTVTSAPGSVSQITNSSHVIIQAAATFEMHEQGLAVVENPSAALLAERRDEDGSVVLATLEGRRPLLVEIQALVNSTNFGYPKRTASGFDLNRLNLLIAVLERRTKLQLSDKDIYINVVGGIKISDPAADLAVCMAIASAAASRRLEPHTVVFGEVGLSGEVRSVTGVDQRLDEAKKLGFTRALVPATVQRSGVTHVDTVRDALLANLQK